ncbi:MAG: long-chain fatty acid--CoA ligase [Archaeoglobaceae archaeon]|nr:long-chain fatty acid--CoA ligase [Archaeoglobaceae archaeon]MDW8013301.1 long-chain fatty acid--CoA ligase [Archaeoglobaceae archaeon]
MVNVVGENIAEIDVEKIERFWLKAYDDGVPKTIDYPSIPAYKMYEQTAKKYPNKIALEFIGTKLTYKQLIDSAQKVVSFLYDLEVKKDDRVVVCLPNTPHYMQITYAIWKVGATVVQANPIYSQREMKHIVENSEAETMFAIDISYNNYRPLIEEGKFKKVVICKVEDYLRFPLNLLYSRTVKKKKFGEIKIEKTSEVCFWSDVMKYERSEKEVEVDPKRDIAVFQYTGGTTGLSKAAMLTHYNIVVNAHQVKAWDPKSSESDVYLAALPMFHSYGFTMSHAGLLTGGKFIIVPDPRNFTFYLKAIHKHKVSVFPGVPTMYVALLNHPDIKKYDLRSVRTCVSGAAPLPVEVKRRWEEVTGGKLVEGYGLSEASPVTHCNPVYGLNKEGSIGIPIPDTLAVIVDDEGTILPPGEIGELAIFGPQVMKGYWKMEDETKKTLINGWLLTGDLAKVDDDGYFYIVDRKKDLIIAGGYNIYPREVEEVLYEHPAVLEAAVIGVPDPYRGETVKAFVVLKPEYKGKITAEELEKFCKDKLAPYKIPRIWEFRDDLPKSMVGKVLRRVLRDEELRKLKK